MSNMAQPKSFAGFNLAIGLPSFAYLPSVNLELSKSIKPTIVGTSVLSSDSGMVALRQNADISGATFSGVTVGNVFLDLNNATIVTYRRKVDTTFRESCLFGSSNSDNNNRVSIHAPWSDGNIYFDFSNIGAGRLVVSAPGFTTAPECYVSVASTARGMELWRNGKLLGSSGSSPTLTTNIGYSYGLGSYLSNSVNTDNQYIYLHVVYPKALSQVLCRSISINPWQIFNNESTTEYLINAASSSNGNASGSVPALTLVPATATATGTAPNGNASGGVPSLTLVPATATASGTTVGNGSASGSVPALTLVPATATANGTGSGNASGSVPALTLVPATATANGTTVGNGSANGSVPSLTLVPATATATGTAPNGNANGSVPSLTLVPATATASGTAAGNGSANGSVPSLTLVPATGFASSVGNGNASGSVPSLTLVPATGFASSVSAGSTAIEVKPPRRTIIKPFVEPYHGDLWDKSIHNPMRFR